MRHAILDDDGGDITFVITPRLLVFSKVRHGAITADGEGRRR